MAQSEHSTMFTALLACLVSTLAVAIALYGYNEGYLDPYIEKIGTYLLKAKAMAEKKKLQAQGQKAGQDFVDSQLQGAQQADQVKSGLGSVSSLKKNL